MGKEKIVRPSEIIGGKNYHKKKKEEESLLFSPPFLRLTARMFDYSTIYLLISLFELFFFEGRSFLPEHAIPLQLVIWMPIEAGFLSLGKTTPGKWLLGLSVTSKTRGRLSFNEALRRSFSVWLRGMGMGLYIIPLFTMFFAYSSLKAKGKTSWDRDERTVVHRKSISTFRYIAAALFVILTFFLTRYYF